MSIPELPLHYHLWISLGVHVLAILYGEFQDWVMKVRYTDIDYFVFSDAARYMYLGQSPYLRHTYRYTPILAFLMIPNHVVCHLWGKFFFSVVDVYVGYLIWRFIRCQGFNDQCAVILSLAWLYNPFTINISTRGSADTILCMLVMQVVHAIQTDDILAAGLVYGFSVHFKIYPVIYCVTFFCILAAPNFTLGSLTRVRDSLKLWQFGISAFVGFVGPTMVFFNIYGITFLKEAYIYHLHRQDFRHNFSPLFYFLYLSQPQTPNQYHLTLALTVLPALMITVLVPVALLYRYPRIFHNLDSSSGRVVLTLFTQTFLFVSFNKVCTSQYFLWYLPLLLMLAPQLKMSVNRFSGLSLLWAIFQVLWLFAAYLLEFGGVNTFLFLWLTSILFLMTNVFTASQLITYTYPFPRREKIKNQ